MVDYHIPARLIEAQDLTLFRKSTYVFDFRDCRQAPRQHIISLVILRRLERMSPLARLPVGTACWARVYLVASVVGEYIKTI
jgi:hypothetical protein